jgi:hypothetical protein
MALAVFRIDCAAVGPSYGRGLGRFRNYFCAGLKLFAARYVHRRHCEERKRRVHNCKTVIARLDRATQYSRVLMRCDAPNEHSGILGPRFRGDDSER